MARRWRAAACVAAALVCSAAALAKRPYKIVTAPEQGTSIQIGRDIAKFVAPAAGIELTVLPSAGSAENVRRLRGEPGVKFAMVQSDVYQAFSDAEKAGNTEARALIRPLRVVLPLYFEELYFIVRADAEIDFVHEMKDSRINVGPPLSGAAMSATTLYRQMFDEPIANSHASYFGNEEALVKLTGDKSLDVVVVVAGQPARLLADMKPEARALIKLLKFDASQPESQAALKTYFAATVRAASYPNLLTEDLPGLAVKAYLVTSDDGLGNTAGRLRQFARALCRNFATLQASGHPKWREVELTWPELGDGWVYHAPMAREMQACLGGEPLAAATRKPATLANACRPQDRALGLCK